MTRHSACVTRCSIGAAMVLLIPSLTLGDFRESAGYYDLIDRIGLENMPLGDNVVIAQIEAAANGAYAPDTSDPTLNHHTFIDRGPGSTGASSHATTVARWFYSLDVGMVPQADPVSLYEAGGWCLDNFLRANYSSNTAPLSMPGGTKVLNHSWIGSFGNVNNDQIVLRRMDYVVTRDEAIIVCGLNNGSGSDHQPLMAYGFNNISVGTRSGNHAAGDTPSNYEGGGRMKPELCADGDVTSWATPVVSGAAAMLVDQRRASGFHSDGDQPEVIKAILMAAANHQDSGADDGEWSNEPSQSGSDRGSTTRPLDAVQGAGQVNVDRGHYIMNGGRVIGGVSPATTPEAPITGWDYAYCSSGNARTWNFTLAGAVDEVSIVATWSRIVSIGFGSNWTMADFDLELVGLDDNDVAVSLVGAGSEVFASGNVLSESAVDTVEHLYLRGLAPGRYQLRASVVGAASSGRAGVAWFFSDPDVVDVPGDINGDGFCNVDDLLQLIAEFGTCNSCPSDLNGDGVTNVDDLLLLLTYYQS